MAGQSWQLWSARGIKVLDILLIVYVAIWLVIGVLIGIDIRRQAELSDQVTRVGVALDDIGKSLQVVGGLPLVGGNIGSLADRVVRAGADVQRSGRDSRQSLERMGVLVGVAFVVIPLMLILPVYVPLRLAWRREVGAVRAALQSADPDSLDRLLARRALASLPYGQVLGLRASATGEPSPQEARQLADAELARLGLVRP
jgi:hypothetical protein